MSRGSHFRLRAVEERNDVATYKFVWQGTSFAFYLWISYILGWLRPIDIV